ncbi:unnamed protein product [Candida verbasci]|uniref:Polyadenylation factor subunit 2 n=1 Tax=Candida verbasci TaxID=1227364 RepID=A0A9W4TX68_9ASCO|nr:unnamed protein product [Candida verbasci]
MSYNRYNNNNNGYNGGGRINKLANSKNPRDQERYLAYQQNLEAQLASQEKKQAFRRITDHGNNMGKWYIEKSLGVNIDSQQQIGKIRPESSYLIDLLPSLAYSSSFNYNRRNNKNNMAICDNESKFVHLSSNKAKHTINTVKWTPEGRRLLVASHSGEFTIWNGMTFNFETIMQAHDSPILTMQYSHSDDWLLSGDQNGNIKYWQSNFNNVNNINAHSNGVRDISFSPNDSKFVTCGDDSNLKIWNFNNGKEERQLTGHHWEVKSCDWHPSLGLIVSGSKDNLIKLWDPRSSNAISTIHGFKHTVNTTRFQPCGTSRLIASVSRDRSCRIFDLRTMKDMIVIRDSETDLSCVAWHPLHASMVTTAAYNGSISHYLLDSYIPDSNETIPKKSDQPGSVEAIHKIPYAHEKAIHALEYHPMGHLLCSAGSDKTARFWSRGRPNDPMAWRDAVYTDDKTGAWYYTVNNNVNAVMEDPNGVKTAAVTFKNPQLEEKVNMNSNSLSGLPGLRSMQEQYSNIPGLRGH